MYNKINPFANRKLKSHSFSLFHPTIFQPIVNVIQLQRSGQYCHRKQAVLIYQSQIHMSNSNPNQQGGYGYLINPYGKPISRLTRSKDVSQDTSITSKPTQSVVTQPSLLTRKGRTQTKQSKNQGLIPSRISDLSSNVVFQDVDSPTKSISRKPVTQQSNEKVQSTNKEVKSKPIGLVGNAFLGATTKYAKIPIEQVSTPIKTIELQQKTTPKNSQPGSTAQNKFSRKRETEISKVERRSELTLNLDIQPESREEGATDRSNLDSGKKIERKTDRSRRELKFGEKKQVQQQTLSQNNFELGQTSKISQKTSSRLTKVQEETKVQNFQTPQPKPYQPIQRQSIQRQNNTTSSRLLTVPAPLESKQVAETKVQIQQKNQTPSIATTYNKPVSSYRPQQKSSYFSKTQTQSQQISSTQKISESTIRTPVQNKNTVVQEQKQPSILSEQKKQVTASLIMQNKSTYGRPKLLSNRFDNSSQKFQPNQQPSSQITHNEPVSNTKAENIDQIPKSLLKKSVLLHYVFKRLISSQLQSSFNLLKLKNGSLKRKATKESLVLCLSSVQIHKNKENRLLRMSFDALKQRFSISYLPQLKSVLLYKPINTTQTSLNILQKIYQSKLRHIVKKLKNKHFWSSNQTKALNLLDRFTKTKQIQVNREGFRLIQLTAKIRWNSLNSFLKIVNSVNKQKIGLAFLKLLASCKPEPKVTTTQKQPTKSFMKQQVFSKFQEQASKVSAPNPALQEKVQKIKAIISSTNDNLKIITKKLKVAQKDSAQQGTELQQKIFLLKQANLQIQNELNNKKGRNTYIQKELKNISSKVQSFPIQDQLEIHDEKLEKLTKIYMGNFKNKEDLVTPAQIFEEYQLNADSCSKSFQEWSLLAENIDLKRQIASYEQVVGPVEFKARKIALGQQQMAAKLVRSYIKQQYFWEWLHLTAQSIQPK